MYFKGVVLIAILGVCLAAEQKHAYSSQSFVRYDDHKEHQHDAPVVSKVDAPVKVVAKEVTPVVTKVAVPVAHYVAESSSQSHDQGKNKHSSKYAVSTQNIKRQDVPAKAPADFYEDYGHPKYSFEYKVEDPHTHDSKYQQETRDGHNVKGVYSLHEADGSIRTVKYSSDKHTGFNAEVKHSTKHEQPKKH